jgi:DNA-binding protein HU-beta
MNKQDLVNKIRKNTKLESYNYPLDESYIRMVLDITTQAIMDGLKADDKLALVGFGAFTTKVRSARTGRNPKTGEVINIPANRVVSFKPGLEFRELVANVSTNLHINKKHLINIQAFSGSAGEYKEVPKIKPKVLTRDENLLMIDALRLKTNEQILESDIKQDDALVTLNISKDNFVKFLESNLEIKEILKDPFFKFRKGYDLIQITLAVD